MPVIDDPVASAKDEDSMVVRLQCVWDYKKSNRNNVQFQARWFGDEKDTTHKIQKSFSANDTWEYVIDFAYDVASFPNFKFNKSGYELNKKVPKILEVLDVNS